MADMFEDDLEWLVFLDDGVSIKIEKKKNNNNQQSWRKTKIRRIRYEKLQ